MTGKQKGQMQAAGLNPGLMYGMSGGGGQTAQVAPGNASCIMNRKDLTKKGYVDQKKPWFYRNDKILDWQNEALNIYYKKYADMVWFRSLLDDARKGDDDNKDEEDAFKADIVTGKQIGRAHV